MPFVLLVIYGWGFFRVQKITCYIKDKSCPLEILKRLDQLKNKNLFLVNLDKTWRNLDIIDFQKKLPDEIILYLNQATATGNNTLEDLLKNKNISYQNISEINNFYLVQLDENKRAILEKNDLDLQVLKLQKILQNLNFKEIDLNIKEIDLRFKMPVLRTKYSIE